MKIEKELSVLIRPESDGESFWWVAQCLELDIAVQARDLEGLDRELTRVLSGHVAYALRKGIDPFTSVSPAPEECWEVWENARRVDHAPAPPQMPSMPPGPTIPSWQARLAS